MEHGRTGPFSDLRVIEMGSLIAGPFCGQLLGDFGAEIIKIEDPARGDPMRQWGREKDGVSLWWPVIARNKKSVTLDLRQPEGQALARRLIATADIVVENFRPGALEKWGLGYASLAADHPRLIMARISGYGQRGPYRDRAGFGAVGEAMGGLRYVTGEADRPPGAGGYLHRRLSGRDLRRARDLMAVHHRERTGQGQIVDSALYEATLAMMESLITDYDQVGYIRERSGSILPDIAPSNVYPCAGGESVLIAANQDTVFRRLATAIGEPGWPRIRVSPATPPEANGKPNSTGASLIGRRAGPPKRFCRRWTPRAFRRAGSTARPRCSPTPISPPARPSSRSSTRRSVR